MPDDPAPNTASTSNPTTSERSSHTEGSRSGEDRSSQRAMHARGMDMGPSPFVSGETNGASQTSSELPEFSLLVAGARGGKTSFLRLMLDTAEISSLASQEQLDSVARFLQGAGGPTVHIRTATVEVVIGQRFDLNIVDTPSLDFSRPGAAETTITDILDYVEERFNEAADNAWGPKPDRFVHLCVYFIDPDGVVPPISVPDSRPRLPLTDVHAIQRLSKRVNVLPVIARADILPNDRLSSIRNVVRTDLAAAGIGFGIFDMNVSGPSVSPALPYALVSPDMYTYDDGVSRPRPTQALAVHNMPRGKFVRSYRWGTLDVVDQSHCDFVQLRAAVFHHMTTLRHWTKDHLYRQKYLPDYRQAMAVRAQAGKCASTVPTSAHVAPDLQTANFSPVASYEPGQDSVATVSDPNASSSGRQRTKKITIASRKLKCDGGRPACAQCIKRQHPCDYQAHVRRRGSRKKAADATASGSESEAPEDSTKTTHTHPREYAAQNGGPPPAPTSQYAQQPPPPPPNEYLRSAPQHDPRVPYNGHIQQAPTMMVPPHPYPYQQQGGVQPRPVLDAMLSSSTVPTASPQSQQQRYSQSADLPHIATLRPDETPSALVVSTSQVPQSNGQEGRPRAMTMPTKTGRLPATSGPKVVACDLCRARKTKCDGALPACASCVRRKVACHYALNSRGGRSGPRRPKEQMPPAPLQEAVPQQQQQQQMEASASMLSLSQMASSTAYSRIPVTGNSLNISMTTGAQQSAPMNGNSEKRKHPDESEGSSPNKKREIVPPAA
ncbi:hypothetical protein FISHEDRAFT_60990 [Fistulina hepatica ATCC 64428]|uniref:Zn(2)-C6 fungal-type domain-containing protein n=1 Tax=Fistulina hepatica ATCC 64428 TaxID=1128425 RepID=A0A0D7A6P5_9AGAR|nr:hypothetical protein FISHEDRAFT_60990 [Fistulina hepatica ATCC 64428]